MASYRALLVIARAGLVMIMARAGLGERGMGIFGFRIII